MTVKEIIDAARHYTQVSGSSFYSGIDELRSVNRSWRDVYERIANADDEFFVNESTLLTSSFTSVRTGVWDVTLPLDFYRLRNLVAVNGYSEIQFARKDPQDIHQGEGYRFHNGKLRFFYIAGYDSFRIEYYPAPIEYTSTADDIVYPPQLEPLIIAYQMAMDITKIQGGDPSKHAEEYARLWSRFESAIRNRDNLRHPKIANIYRSTLVGY